MDIAGRELANAFSELTDPVEQRKRLEDQVAAHRRAGGTVPSIDAEPASAAKAGGFGGSQEAPYEVQLLPSLSVRGLLMIRVISVIADCPP